MEDFDEEGPFRYRSGVRVIAIFDTVLSIYLLVYLGVMVFMLDIKDTDIPMGNLSKEHHRNITLALWIVNGVVHFLQLLSALILVCATAHSDASYCRTRCQLWLYYANFVCLMLVSEIVLLVFNFSKHGMRVYPMTIWGIKVIFRLIARQLVKYYIKDLTSAPPNTVEAQFYQGVPKMYTYSSEYLNQNNPKKERKY